MNRFPKGSFLRAAVAAAGLAAVATISAACSVDVDKYHAATNGAGGSGGTGGGNTGGGNNSQFADLHLKLLGMKPHLSHRFEYRVINSNNFIQFRGYMDPIGLEDVTLFAGRAFPKAGQFRLDFYADVNNSGDYDGIGSAATNDHAWRIDPLTVDNGVCNVEFQHNFSFTDLFEYPKGTPAPAMGTGISAKVHLKGMTDFINKLVEVRVLEKDSGHTVAVYRFPQGKEMMDAVMVDTVEASTDYIVEIYGDKLNPGKYDTPGDNGDAGWRIPVTTDSGGGGIEIDFDPSNPKFGAGTDDVGFTQLCRSPPAKSSTASTRSSGCSARAAWVRSTRARTSASSAGWQSRCSTPRSRRRPRSSSGSSARPKRPRASGRSTSSTCSTSAIWRTAPASSSWSTSTARRSISGSRGVASPLPAPRCSSCSSSTASTARTRWASSTAT